MKKVLLFLSLTLVLMINVSTVGAYQKVGTGDLFVDDVLVGDDLVVEIIFENKELFIPLEEMLNALNLNVVKEGDMFFDFAGEKFICKFDYEESEDLGEYAFLYILPITKKDSLYADDFVELGPYINGICVFIEEKPYISQTTAEYLSFFLGYDIIFDKGKRTARLKLANIPPTVERYLDVPEGEWYSEAIEYVIAEKYMAGITPIYFEPNTLADRATIVSALYNIEGSPLGHLSRFEDVKSDSIFYNSIGWAQYARVVNGVGKNKFAPTQNVTRQDFAVMLWRYMKYCGFEYREAEKSKIFADDAIIADYAREAVQSLNSLGIMNGKGNNVIDPRGSITRAEVATMLHRMTNVANKMGIA